MNIYIFGTGRCGSSKLYNFILRLCECQISKMGHGHIKYGYAIKIDIKATYNIIKNHTLTSITKKDIVFFPVRDMRDAAVSALDNKYFHNNVRDFTSDQMKRFKSFKSDPLWDMYNIVRYENFDANHIAEILGITMTTSELEDILNYINGKEILNQPYQKVLMHKTAPHGTDRAIGKYKTRLSVAQIKIIDDMAKDYQVYFNY